MRVIFSRGFVIELVDYISARVNNKKQKTNKTKQKQNKKKQTSESESSSSSSSSASAGAGQLSQVHYIDPYGVGDAAVSSSVPRIEVQRFVLDPAAIARAQLQSGDADDPIGRRAEHGHERHQMVFAVDAENGVRFPVDVGVPKSSRFDDGSDVVALVKIQRR